jgi:hypothetical protein
VRRVVTSACRQVLELDLRGAGFLQFYAEACALRAAVARRDLTLHGYDSNLRRIVAEEGKSASEEKEKERDAKSDADAGDALSGASCVAGRR